MAAFAEEVIVLSMDDCWVHASDDAIHILTEARVRVLTVAPHTTQVFQVLDLTLDDFSLNVLSADDLLLGLVGSGSLSRST
jgi:hypothetical protein